MNDRIVCKDCNKILHIPTLQHQQKANCPRCGHVVKRHFSYAKERILAFAISSLIFLCLSLPFTFIGFNANGTGHEISVVSSMLILIEQGHTLLAIVQLLATIVIPTLVLMGLIYILLPITGDKQARSRHRVLIIIYRILPWAMVEIFLVGVLVSLIKISSLADIALGLSFYAYIVFTVLTTVTFLYMDKDFLFSIIRCDVRHIKSNSKPHSVQYTWALLITAIILYIPANLYPIMITRFLGGDEPSTIIGGVFVLWEMGSFPIAIIIFIASVMIPIAKLFILILLNYSIQKNWKRKRRERMFWYRIIEFIGRWSMIDVFVVIVLVSLVQGGNTMSVYPGPAVISFCGVVILTMLAAMTLNTHLIWNEPPDIEGLH